MACPQPYSLEMLEEKLKGMYRTVTEGKFSDALRQVNTLLAVIPLTVVDSRREVDEIKELISIAKCASRTPLGSRCPQQLSAAARLLAL
jgi:coatomer protein complex subunit alpha (xenin)